jgi:hypothetical protein
MKWINARTKLGVVPVVMVDDEDEEKCLEYTWRVDPKKGYVRSHRPVDGKDETVLIHRLVMGAGKGMVVDHINHDHFDNRKCNLRVCTQQENCMNRLNPVNRNSRSGQPGVSWDAAYNKWKATIYLGKGKRKHVGHFETVEEAVAAREAAKNG